MRNLTLPLPAFVASRYLLMIITCALSFVSKAQDFVYDWQASQRGPQLGFLPALTINPENGDSYVLEERYGVAHDHVNYWNIIKYDDGGRLIWTLRYVEGIVGHVIPETILFKNGAECRCRRKDC